MDSACSSTEHVDIVAPTSTACLPFNLRPLRRFRNIIRNMSLRRSKRNINSSPTPVSSSSTKSTGKSKMQAASSTDSIVISSDDCKASDSAMSVDMTEEKQNHSGSVTATTQLVSNASHANGTSTGTGSAF